MTGGCLIQVVTWAGLTVLLSDWRASTTVDNFSVIRWMRWQHRSMHYTALHLCYHYVNTALRSFPAKSSWCQNKQVCHGVKVCSYIAQYAVCRTAQSVLHCTPLQTCSFQCQLNISSEAFSHSAIIAWSKFLTYPPLSIGWYSLIQLTELEQCGVHEIVQALKHQ